MDAGGIDLAILDGEAVPGGMGLCRQLKDEVVRCPPILVLTAQDAESLGTTMAEVLGDSHRLDQLRKGALARAGSLTWVACTVPSRWCS
jgi:hypothetical protein